MPIYRGRIVNNQPSIHWPAFNAECRKHADKGFIVEVRPYSPDNEISRQQMKWLHCDAGPIKTLSDYQGISRKEAQNELKRKCGRQWFIDYVTDENCNDVEGQIFYECQWSFCNKLTHPAKLIGQDKLCPFCGKDTLLIINIKSKTTLSIKQTNEWFTEIFDFMDAINRPVMPPDPKWYLNRIKEGV